MKYSLLIISALVISASAAFGQLQIDRSLDLTSPTPGNARVKGIKEVSDPQDAVSAEVLQNGSLTHASVAGGTNSYTLTFSPPIATPYSEGMMITFKANGDNTGAVTLNTIPLRKDVSNLLAAGDIKDDQIVTVVFDGANFQLASRTNSGSGVTSVSTGAANNGITASWANATTTPTLTIGLGNITPSSVAATGTVTGSNLSGTNTGDQNLSGLAPNTRNLTINGTTHNLTADRTWNVGTVTSLAVTGNNGISVNLINATTTPALTLGLGAITPTSVAATGTVTGSNLSGTHTGTSSGTNTGDQTLSGLGGVPTSRTITINGTGFDLSANRSWSVGTVTGSGTQNYVPKWNNAGGTALGNSSIFDNGTLIGIGHAGPTAKLDMVTGTLGATAGSVIEMLRMHAYNGNGSMLDIRQIRTAAGSDWSTAGIRLQQKIDADWKGYMQFNGYGYDGSITFGTGSTGTAPGNVPERMKIDGSGNVTVNNLAGTGIRAVYADASGTLKTATSTIADWRLVHRDDFESGVNNWKCYTSTVGAQVATTFGTTPLKNGFTGSILSNCGYTTANPVFKKGYDLSAYPHTEVFVKLTFYYIDSWDGEVAWFGLAPGEFTAPVKVWYEGYDYDANGPYMTSAGATSMGGAMDIAGYLFSDKMVPLEAQIGLTGNTIWVVTATSGLSSTTSTDESYGIDNVEIYVR